MNENTSTTNAILVILLVIVVGFIVWFMVGRQSVTPAADTTPGTSLEVNLGGGTPSGGTNTGGTGTNNQ
jgi:hypothetical protein